MDLKFGAGRFDRQRLAGTVLAVVALIAAVALLATNPRLLVALASDRDGEALLPVGTLAPGSSTAGDLVLANEGLLPLSYDLKVTGGTAGPDAGLYLRVRRPDRAGYLYQGPPPGRPVPLGTLAPGERVRLEVILSAASSPATASVPVDGTFTWTGHSPGLDGWWWLVLVAALLVLAAFLMPRALQALRSLRRAAPPPFELYWRVPLVLATVVLAMLVPLSGVSLATLNAQTSNPGNLFAIGSLVLSDRTPTGTTCISVTGQSAPGTSTPACSAIFQFARRSPGDRGIARVTIRNQGTVPVGRLALWAPAACATADAPGEPLHGSGDLCGRVLMTVHDDTHDTCFYPLQAPGACPDGEYAATMRSFSTTYTDAHPLALRPDGLGSGITYSFGVVIAPDTTNEFQGRAPSMEFDWRISSPA